jgi:hypothetical protein
LSLKSIFENPSQRPLCVLCVSAVNLCYGKVHRRDAEAAEGARRLLAKNSAKIFLRSDRLSYSRKITPPLPAIIADSRRPLVGLKRQSKGFSHSVAFPIS